MFSLRFLSILFLPHLLSKLSDHERPLEAIWGARKLSHFLLGVSIFIYGVFFLLGLMRERIYEWEMWMRIGSANGAWSNNLLS